MRRNLVLEKASIPEAAEGALRSIEDVGHPWRGSTLSREDWAENLDIKVLADNSAVDILFWVGCTESLTETGVKIAQAVAKLSGLAGVKLSILGFEESCCGEPARRLGNEYLFQTQARKNIELFKKYHVKTIITACPHCYNTLKNEYPQFGCELKIIHHTEFIADLLEDGKLKISKAVNSILTYHDACYLGRYNGIFEPPRQILKRIPDIQFIEMEHNREHSFCCGGGGGHMWLPEGKGRKISEMRIEQAIKTEAQTVVTACPWCLEMLSDAVREKELQGTLKVMDIAELVDESM